MEQTVVDRTASEVVEVDSSWDVDEVEASAEDFSLLIDTGY